MNWLLVWPGADADSTAVGVAETNRGLPGVGADAEHVEFELRLHRAFVGRQLGPDAEPALPHAQIEASVLAELIGEHGSCTGG